MNMDPDTLIRCDRVLLEVMGKPWFDRALEKKQEQENAARKQLPKRKHQYIYQQAMHPLAKWQLAFGDFLRNAVKTRRLETSVTVHKYILLGKMLDAARHQPGFENLRRRLRIGKEFFAAMFEVEVAYFYLTNNCKVEFIETGDYKSPDLKVTSDKGEIFWVECKCRDERTERDKNISAAWEDLESRLLRVMGPRKLNYSVFIKSHDDPIREEMDQLFSFIMALVNSPSRTHDKNRDSAFVQDPTGRYDVLVEKLAMPDELVDSGIVNLGSLEDTDRASAHVEQLTDKGGKSAIKNPMILKLRTATPPDKVSGIVHGVKSAVAQLPEAGPGVIWVRMPDDYWNKDLEKWFGRAESLLHRELDGRSNRRVNRVNVMTRVFVPIEQEGQTGYKCQFIVNGVDHPSPRKNLHAKYNRFEF